MPDATARKMFVNLAVEDLDRSVEFFTQLGFTFDQRFTDESATCMVVSDEAFVMLLVKPRFKDFTTKELADAKPQTEAILAVSADSREASTSSSTPRSAPVAPPANEPMDMGSMYSRSFNDPDGHLWEVMWMDPAALEELSAQHRRRRRRTTCNRWATASTREQLGAVIALCRDVLGPDLAGAYLHGSAVLGGLRRRSDLDVLAVSTRRTTLEEKRQTRSTACSPSRDEARWPDPVPSS